MDNLSIGFPEWTELGQDSGLDPLGMQRPIEMIFQALLPGISTITLRYRYYSFFPWILKYYEDHLRSNDPMVFRRFQRRCETLFALICGHGKQELGIAGSDWASRKLNEGSTQVGAETIFDFCAGADPDADLGQRYLRNKGGAFGGIYATQMAEMGLIIFPDPDQISRIPICSERGLELATALEAELGAMADKFFGIVSAGHVSHLELEQFSLIKPSNIRLNSYEHILLKDTLLGSSARPSDQDKMRRSTMKMLLHISADSKGIPSAEYAKWRLYEACINPKDGQLPSSDADVLKLWGLYQACDLMRLAYETILVAALSLLDAAPLRRMTLDIIVAELVSFIAPPANTSWAEYLKSVLSMNAHKAVQHLYNEMLSALQEGDIPKQVTASVHLIIKIADESAVLAPMMEKALNSAGHFQSLKTEIIFLNSCDANSVELSVGSIIRERILLRHLWVASRKFRNQKAYTFLMEPEEGLIRYRSHFRTSPSSPRIDQALRFLKDAMLIDEHGVTDLGQKEMATL